jgi:hypothetical protein
MPINYRTRASGNDYSFDFARIPGSWRIYIRMQPDYHGRDTSPISTHRLRAGAALYICWDRPIATLGQAKTVAANWAEGTDRYILSGNAATAFAQPMFTDFTEDPRAERTFARIERGDPEPHPAAGELDPDRPRNPLIDGLRRILG